MKALIEMGLLVPCSQADSSVFNEKYRHQYYELSSDGAREIGLENYKKSTLACYRFFGKAQ